MGVKRRIIKNIVAVQISETVTKVLNFLFGIFVARMLPLEVFGQWLLVFVFFRLFALFTNIGIQDVATRDIPRNPEFAGKYLIHLFFIKGALAVILSIVLIFTIWLLKYPPKTTLLLYFAVPILIISTLNLPLVITLGGLERMEITSAFGLGSTLLYVSLGVICLWRGYGIIALLWVGIICEFISFVLKAGVVQKYFFKIRLEFDISFCKYLLKQGWYFGLANLLGFLLYKLNFLFLSKLKGESAVGIYGSAYRLIEPALFSVRGVRTAIRPTLSGLFVSSPDKAKAIHKRLMNLVLTIIPPLLFLITIFSEELVLLIYGEKFLPAKDVVTILTWTVGALMFTMPMRVILSISSEFPKFVFFRVVTTILNIILNIILIPRYSYIGAAIVTLICVVLELPVCIFLFKRVFKGTQVIRVIAKGSLGVIGMIGIYMLTNKLNIVINAGLPVIGYLLILRSLGIFKIENIKEIFKKKGISNEEVDTE
ncbi:MAG: flippase [bacterium]